MQERLSTDIGSTLFVAYNQGTPNNPASNSGFVARYDTFVELESLTAMVNMATPQAHEREAWMLNWLFYMDIFWRKCR